MKHMFSSSRKRRYAIYDTTTYPKDYICSWSNPIKAYQEAEFRNRHSKLSNYRVYDRRLKKYLS